MTILLLLLLHLFPTAQPAVTPSSETRDVATFTHIAVAATVTVLVHQGSPQRVTIEAAPEDLARLETSVAHDELRIRDRTADAWRGNGRRSVNFLLFCWYEKEHDSLACTSLDGILCLLSRR